MLPLIGSALLLLLLLDVFLTVFSPQGRGGPVNRRQNRAMWALCRRLAGLTGGSRRNAWLALAGPLLVVSTLTVWMIWLVVGFAMIYHPWISSFLVSPGSLRTPVVEALYYSGYTAATLGIGDLVADSQALRLITLLEAFGGFALLSTSVTYFLAVYRELIRKQALAATIGSYFRGGDVHRVCKQEPGGYDALARWTESISGPLQSVLLAHFQYPVLHYFRSAVASRALPLQIGCFIELRRLVREAAPSDPVAALARHPSYLALEVSLEEYVKEVEALFGPGEAEHDDGTHEEEIERAHRRMLEYLLYR